MTTPVNFPRWCHLMFMYQVILCLTITAAHTSDHDNPRFKFKAIHEPYHYGLPSPSFISPELRVSLPTPPSPLTHMNPRRGVPPMAPESPPPQSPASPPPPDSADDSPPPAMDIPSPPSLSGSLRVKRRLTPPPPDPNRNYINPRPPFMFKSPPPPSRSPPPPPTPHAYGFSPPPSH